VPTLVSVIFNPDGVVMVLPAVCAIVAVGMPAAKMAAITTANAVLAGRKARMSSSSCLVS